MSQTSETKEKKAHFANENVQVEVVFLPHCKVHVHLQVQPVAMEAARHSAFKSLKKEISVPGFRKGKVPDAFIHKHYAKAWQQETEETAVRVAIREAVQLSGLRPLTHFRRMHNTPRAEEASFCFSAECELEPSIPWIDVEILGLQEVHFDSISDRKVELLLHKVLLPKATLQPITDRGLQEGDVGEFDIFLLTEPPKHIVKEQKLEVEEEEFLDWMRDQMRGMRAGETRRLEPIDADKERGMVPLELHLRELFSITWPDLTQEEILKELKVETEADLRAALRKRLEKEAALQADVEMSHRMAVALLTKYSFDLPTSMVYPRWEEYLRVYSEKNKEGEKVEVASEERRVLLQKAVEDIQLEMLLQSIGTRFGIEATQEDITEELLFQLELLPMGKNQLDLLKGKEIRDPLKQLAFQRKIRKFLFSQGSKAPQLLSVDSQEG